MATLVTYYLGAELFSATTRPNSENLAPASSWGPFPANLWLGEITPSDCRQPSRTWLDSGRLAPCSCSSRRLERHYISPPLSPIISPHCPDISSKDIEAPRYFPAPLERSPNMESAAIGLASAGVKTAVQTALASVELTNAPDHIPSCLQLTRTCRESLGRLIKAKNEHRASLKPSELRESSTGAEDDAGRAEAVIPPIVLPISTTDGDGAASPKGHASGRLLAMSLPRSLRQSIMPLDLDGEGLSLPPPSLPQDASPSSVLDIDLLPPLVPIPPLTLYLPRHDTDALWP